MTGDPRFHDLLTQIGELHDAKQRDYGADSDPFANVRASERWGIQPWVGALVRLNDKVHRLQQFALKGELENESAEDSMMDIAVYALIALILYREETEGPRIKALREAIEQEAWELTDRGVSVETSEACWCCEAAAPVEAVTEWEGRLDGYCLDCALARCDTSYGDCGRRVSLPGRWAEDPNFVGDQGSITTEAADGANQGASSCASGQGHAISGQEVGTSTDAPKHKPCRRCQAEGYETAGQEPATS